MGAVVRCGAGVGVFFRGRVDAWLGVVEEMSMGIALYRLPPQLGGGVVNPVRAGDGRFEVKLPGTAWVITVPGECLKAVLPDEPTVGSVVWCVVGQLWDVYRRVGVAWFGVDGHAAKVTWETLHKQYDEVVVLLDMTPDRADRGWKLDGLTGNGLTVRCPWRSEGGAVVTVRMGSHRVQLDRENALRLARAILTTTLGPPSSCVDDEQERFEG